MLCPLKGRPSSCDGGLCEWWSSKVTGEGCCVIIALVDILKDLLKKGEINNG